MADQSHYDAESVEQTRDEPQASKPWLALIEDAEKCFRTYQEKCDKIEESYASLKTASETTTDRELQIFWANLEVLKPTIYSRPPVPVVVPRFKNRRELPRKASELLERAMVTQYEQEDINGALQGIRDDLTMDARGALWLRYEANQNEDGSLHERIPFEHVDRTDFLHEPARKWADVTWVARRSYLTLKQGLARFEETSGNAFMEAEFKEKDTDKDKEYRGEKKAPVWEIWHKTENKVIWVTVGVDVVLDIDDPHLNLVNFFPCPKPAFGTLQPRSMVPVPDYIFYQDQIAEIDELTARISALSESLRMKGFYSGGNEDVGDAIERALDDNDNRATLIPVSNFAGLGGVGLSEAVLWWPVREVALVIKELVELRRQMIDDVYQITGLSDIMRGDTDSRETLGAQELKSQYGAIRIRSKQQELARVAVDATRIAAEIMAENFQPETLLSMSQVDDLPTNEQIAQKGQELQQKIEQMRQDPKLAELAQQQPQEAQKLQQEVKARMDALQNTVTVEKVFGLLREQRIRPFVLDVETDSTIQADENAEKQRRTEFVTAVGGFVREAMPVVQAAPQAAELFAEVLKFLAAPFRAGRELEGIIDEFAEKMKQAGGQRAQQPNPEQVKAQMEGQKLQADMARRQADMEMSAQKHQGEIAKLQAGLRESETKIEMMRIELEGKREDRQRAQFEAYASENAKAANGAVTEGN